MENSCQILSYTIILWQPFSEKKQNLGAAFSQIKKKFIQTKIYYSIPGHSIPKNFLAVCTFAGCRIISMD